LKIRQAKQDDAVVILQLIKDLALYEKAPDEVRVTEKEILETIFAPNPSVFADLIEIDGQVVAIAIWFLNYSTWQGKHGIYLEDLYVKPEFRGRGYGRALLQHLAKICLERGYGRFQWWVLDWNSPAIEFYRSLGAEAMDDWTVYRLSGQKLKELGQ
jgi:GNAT superfamily N-acetyltransferase